MVTQTFEIIGKRPLIDCKVRTHNSFPGDTSMQFLLFDNMSQLKMALDVQHAGKGVAEQHLGNSMKSPPVRRGFEGSLQKYDETGIPLVLDATFQISGAVLTNWVEYGSKFTQLAGMAKSFGALAKAGEGFANLARLAVGGVGSVLGIVTSALTAVSVPVYALHLIKVCGGISRKNF